jgi:hypothetical protein
LGVVAVLVLVFVGVAKAGLVQGIQIKQNELGRLRTVKTGLLSQKAQVKALEFERSDLERQLAILSGLRGGAAAKQTLLAVDRALNGNVWFVSWSFRRTGELVDEAPETVNTGYFIVVPAESRDEPERAWRLRSHMEIRAQAASHSALASFVRQLVDQPEVEDVKVVNTRVHRYTNAQVVSFELAVVIKSEG